MERKSEKIKILFTIPNFDTAGSGKALFNIATRLEKTNFEPHIACSHNEGAFFNVVEGSGIPVHLLQTTTSMTNRFNGFLQCWKISRKMKEINPDMIHSFHYAPDYSEALAAWIAGIPWVFTKKNMNWGGKSKNGWRVRSFLAKHIIVQNKDMIGRFYPSSQKITLIPRGVNLQDFKPKKSLDETKTHLGIPPTSKVIITIANLTPVKGMEYLIEAFRAICEDYESYYLIIVGDDSSPYVKQLKERVNAKNKGDRIIFAGKRSDISNILQSADIFVLPTIKKKGGEGSPVALLEAMASGIPVLASNVSGSRDILSDKPGQLFLPENTTSLLDKLNWIISLDKKDRDDLIQNQLEIIDKKYSIEREVEQHELLYKNIFLHYA